MIVYQDIFQKLKSQLYALFLRRVGFWSNGLYDFAIRDNALVLMKSNESPFRKWIVIVGRAHYFESVRIYPIGDLKDLRRALKNEPWRFPHQGEHFFRIARESETEHRVSSWVVKQNVLVSLNKPPFFLIPESLCAERLSQHSVVILERMNETVFVADTPDGLKSSQGQKEAFLRELGRGEFSDENADNGFVKIKSTDVPNTYLEGMLDCLKGSPAIFFMGFNHRARISFPSKKAVVASTVFFLFYLALTSSYLFFSNLWADRQLRLTSELASSALTLRKDISRYEDKLNSVNSILSGGSPHWIAWDVFLDLIDKGVMFRAVNSLGSETTFFAKAPRASDVLEFLTDDPRVAAAEFTMPIRKVNGIEEFVITAEFRQGNALNSEVQQSLMLDKADVGSVTSKVSDPKLAQGN